MSDYEVVTPAPVRKLIDALAGKRAGYQRVYHQLEHDPCAPELRAYRLSGPLEPIVCGVHLDRGFRLAFTMQPAEASGTPARVVVLYVGQREPRHRQREGNLPDIDQDQLDAFIQDLQRMVSGGRSSRRRRSSD